MKNYLLLLLTVLAVSSCTNYNIVGSSDLQDVDGRMLFLKGLNGDDLVSMDSTDIVHGKFKFHGALDSVRVVALYIDDVPVMPVVLESGEITVKLNSQKQVCSGTPLNDTLSLFNEKYQQIMAQLQDLTHEHDQAIMNGDDMEEVAQRLMAKQQSLEAQEDKLITSFIIDNFNNCLGPYAFEMVTSGYQYPMLTPWIEALMSKATDTFKNAHYVKEYMRIATENQDILTGVAEPKQQLPPPPPASALPNTPTPNELAQPAE